MKRIFIIIALFVLIINSYGQSNRQSNIKRDRVEATEELIFQGLDMQDWLEDSTGASTIGGENGAYKDGNNIGIGRNPLIEDTETPGNSYNYSIGTSASRTGQTDVWANRIDLKSNGSINITTDNIDWNFNGEYLTARIDGVTDTMYSGRQIRELLASFSTDIIQPFNWNYEYGATYTDDRPGIGIFKMNNSFIPSVTEIYIDNYDLLNVENSALVDFVADTGSYFWMYNKSEETWKTDVFAIFQLTGGIVQNAGYTTYKVTNIYNNDPVLSDGDEFELVLISSNSTGSGGGGGVADSTFSVVTAEDTLKTPLLILNKGVSTVLSLDNPYIMQIDDGEGKELFMSSGSGQNGMRIAPNYTEFTGYQFSFTGISAGGFITLNPGGTTDNWRIYDEGIYKYSGNTRMDTAAMLADITGGGSSGSDSSLISSTNQVDLILDTLEAPLVNGQFKTLSVTDSIFINNMWVNGVDTSTTRVIDVDKVTTDTLSLAGVEVDSIIELKYAVENESFGDVNIDTISPSNDSLLIQGKIISDYYIGQLYTDDGSVTLSTTPIDTYVAISGMSSDISENLTLTSSSITVPTGGSGYYDVYGGFSYTHSTGNTICHISLFINDVEYTINEAQRKIGTGGDTGDAGRGSIVWLNDGDVITFRAKADNTGTITIEHGNIHVARRN